MAMATADHERDKVDAPQGERRVRWPRFYLVGAKRATADLEVVIALSGIVALLALWLLPVDWLASRLGECRFKSVFGIPCASCGVTRGVVALSRGKFREALALNPLLISLILAGVAYTPWALIAWVGRLPRLRLSMGSGWPRHLLLGVLLSLVVLLLGLNWAYLIARGI